MQWIRDIEAEISYLRTEEGGRRKPAFSGYRPQFVYDGRHWDAIHDYGDVERVYPGETAVVYLSFLSPHCHIGKLYPGKEFFIYEGAHMIARGTVTRILNLAKSAADLDTSGCD